MTSAGAAEQLRLLLEVVHQANDAHRRDAKSLRELVEDGEDPREWNQLVHCGVAGLSTAARRQMEELLVFLLDGLDAEDVSQRGAFAPSLRLVSEGAG